MKDISFVSKKCFIYKEEEKLIQLKESEYSFIEKNIIYHNYEIFINYFFFF